MTSTRLHGPTADSVLEALTQERLLDLSRAFGIGLRSGREAKGRMAGRLGEQLSGRLPTLLRELGRDELRVSRDRDHADRPIVITRIGAS